MTEAMDKHCILNVGIGGWYPRGSARQRHTLKKMGYSGDLLHWNKTYPTGSPSHQQVPYAFKPHAFAYAREQGYRLALWCDSALWCTRHPQPIFDIIKEQGHYFVDNGFNCAQTCTDLALKNEDISRDHAEHLPELTGCILGLHLQHPRANTFLDQWLARTQDGSFHGSWVNDPKDSADPRFLFARHDQSVASLLANRLGMAYHPPGELFSYYRPDLPDTICFVNRGM